MMLKYGYQDEAIDLVVTEIEKLSFLDRIAFSQLIPISFLFTLSSSVDRSSCMVFLNRSIENLNYQPCMVAFKLF